MSWGIVAFSFISLIFLSRSADRAFYWDTTQPVTIIAAASGFVARTIFSVLIATRYGQRRIEDLRASRMAAWGALSAGTAAGIVRIAQSGSAKQLESGTSPRA